MGPGSKVIPDLREKNENTEGWSPQNTLLGDLSAQIKNTKPMACAWGNCSLGIQTCQLAYFAYTKQPAVHKTLAAITDLD